MALREDSVSEGRRRVIDRRDMPVVKLMPRPDGQLGPEEELFLVDDFVERYLLSKLDNLLQAYVEQEAFSRETPTGYSPVEGQKIRIAEWLLRFLGIEPDFDIDPTLPVEQLVLRKTKKTVIPTELRWEVWRRDNFTCKHCGSRHDLTVDHIIAESKGGPTTIENLQTLCRPCNSRKGAK